MYSRILALVGFIVTRTWILASAKSILCLRVSSLVIRPVPFDPPRSSGIAIEATEAEPEPRIAAYAEGFLSGGGGGAAGAAATAIGLTLNLDIY